MNPRVIQSADRRPVFQSGPQRVVITPQVARDLLAMVDPDKQRPLDQKRVRRYAGDMAGGRWVERTTDAIGIGPNGHLDNGQHRLHAVILADRPIEFLLVCDVAPDAFAVIDSADKRSPSDILHIAGYRENRGHNANAARVWTRLVLGPAAVKTRATVSNRDMLQALDEHPRLVEWVREARPVAKLGSIGTFAALCYAFEQAAATPEQPHDFLHGIVTGEGLQQRDPRYRLRERLTEDRIRRIQRHEWVVIAWTIKAWNAHREGRPLAIIRQFFDEKFPEVAGGSPWPREAGE